MQKSSKKPLIYLKNAFVEEDKALINVKERGFRFGDGIFETIRVTAKNIYNWDFHLNRLNAGLLALKIKQNTKNLLTICSDLLGKNSIHDGFLRISISRGIGSTGYLPNENIKPTLIIETIDGHPDLPASVSVYFSRYTRPDPTAIPTNFKTMQGLNSTLARMEALEQGHFEALLLNNQGYVAECSSSNIFLVKNNIISTPSLVSGALEGSIRDRIIALSPYEVRQKDKISKRDVESADEVFLTNCAWLAMPVNSFLESKWHKFDVGVQLNNALKEDIAKP